VGFGVAGGFGVVAAGGCDVAAGVEAGRLVADAAPPVLPSVAGDGVDCSVGTAVSSVGSLETVASGLLVSLAAGVSDSTGEGIAAFSAGTAVFAVQAVRVSDKMISSHIADFFMVAPPFRFVP
jgi:hypothetical protein